MKVADVTPYIILGFSVAAGWWGAKRATEIQKKAAAATDLGDVLDPEKRTQIKSEMQGQAEDWFQRLNNGLGVFMLASAASAVQSNNPGVYAFSALFLLPALAPSFISDTPCYLLALREKNSKSLFESCFYRHLQDTYYGHDFKKPFLFWLGVIALVVPLTQEFFF